MNKPIIKLEKVNKIYNGSFKNQVLFDIDLEINANSLNSIIGQSGSGKTTLANIIGTLDTPTTGNVFIKGNSTQKMTRSELANLRNESIGFIFQFHYLLPEFSVLENVLMPAFIKNTKSTQMINRAKELIDFVGLSKYINYQANKISGGQQQRVAIARALMNKPDIIIADEPTGNLDSITSNQVFKLFCKVNREFGTCFIIITHDLRIAQNTDRIIEIKDGKIVNDKKNYKNRSCN